MKPPADPKRSAARTHDAIQSPPTPLHDAPNVWPAGGSNGMTPEAQIQRACTDLGLPVTDTQLQQLQAYLSLLQRWNKVYNLTALRDPAAMLTHHLLDCLAVLPPLTRETQSRCGAAARLLDVGSGGGLPGVVLAIMAPQLQVRCVDTVGKKVGFIRQVAAELHLANLQGLHSRVEQLPAAMPGYDLIVSRAFASLSDFTALTRHLLADKGCWAAMKGKPTAEELNSLPSGVAVFHVEQLAVPQLDAERCLVWMTAEAAPARPAAAVRAPSAPNPNSP